MLATGSGEMGEEVSYPCSFFQERFWQSEELRHGDPAFYASFRWRIKGELSQKTLEQAWQALVARHEILRTRFERRGDTIRQIVLTQASLHVAVVDCSVLEKSAIEAEILRIAAADARRPFDLSKAPLIRVTRIVVDGATSVLLVSAHQIICDGWSFGILAREMGTICDALQSGRRPELSPLTNTFGTFARWQRGALSDAGLAEELALLKQDFKDARPFEIKLDFSRPPVWSSNVESRSLILDGSAVQSFLAEARLHGATPYMAMLAVCVIILADRSHLAKVTLTTQVACRDEVDIENVVGPFVNTIPLQFDVSRGMKFGDFLDYVSGVFANAIELRHVPFDCVSDEIFGPVQNGHGASSNINFICQKAFAEDAVYSSFQLESQHSRPGGTRNDLSIYVIERPKSWRVSCDYNPDLFVESTIDSLLQRFQQIIERSIDTRDPVLFFHSDLFADGYYAEEIAASIPEFRIVPVHPHGSLGLPMLQTIDAMADDYIQRLEMIQPHGPYRLIGFCSGAQAAFEVARRLEKRNEIVEQVILINATAPAPAVIPFRDSLIRMVGFNTKIDIGLRESICYNLARLNRALLAGPRTTATFLYRTLRSLIRRRKFGSGLQPGESYVREKGDYRSELSIGHIATVLAQRPHLFAGDLTLVWSQDQNSLTGEKTQGWNQFSRSVEVIPMSGGHVAPLHTLVGELAQILRNTLVTAKPSSRNE
jgi:non-ribosomal peptide synthetase component F